MSLYTRTKSFLKNTLAKGTDVTFELDTIASAFDAVEAAATALEASLLNAITAAGTTVDVKVNYSATSAPAVTDDSASGYAPGSRWVDLTNDKAYICLDATVGAAVWVEITYNATTVTSLITSTTTGKQTIWVPVGAMTPATTSGAASIATTELTAGQPEVVSCDFDTSADEYLLFSVALPKGWNEGTVTFVPYWTAASGSGGVSWALQAVALSNDDAHQTAFGTQQLSEDTLITANDIHVGPESSAITIAGTPAEGDIVFFRVLRDVSQTNDTLAVDAKLLGIKLHFTTDAPTDD